MWPVHLPELTGGSSAHLRRAWPEQVLGRGLLLLLNVTVVRQSLSGCHHHPHIVIYHLGMASIGDAPG